MRETTVCVTGSARVPDGTRVYVIGDVHGCAKLLDRLHDLIEADLEASPIVDPQLVYLGDYIDRGPDTAGVLDRLAGDSPHGLPRTLLKGNHEAMLEAFLDRSDGAGEWRQHGGNEALRSYRVNIAAALANGGSDALAAALAEAMPAAHSTVLGRLLLSHTIGDYFFCHAGVRPGVPLAQQSERDLLWIRREFVEWRGGFEKVIVHGHTPIDDVDLSGQRINVDTGAYATGRLTCLVLEGNERRLLST